MTAGITLAALAACTSDVRFGDRRDVDGGSTTPPPFVDADNDGFSVEMGDCNDHDDTVGPGLGAFPESCDGLDNDCGGRVDWDDIPGGTNKCATAESFEQFLKVDVLFVVDTTVNMGSFAANLAMGARDILKALVGDEVLDSHVGAVSMDLTADGSGELLVYDGQRFISGSQIGPPPAAHSLNWAEHFLDGTIANNPTAIAGSEGRGAVSLALSSELTDGLGAPNAGFLRPDAHLVLVFLSNDEDQTVDPSVDMFEAELTLLKGSLSDVTIHAIVQEGELDCDGDSMPSKKGYTYQRLAQDTAGTILSICEEMSYAGFFEAMGQNSAYEGLQTHFPLPVKAKSETVEVTVIDAMGNERELLDFALADDVTTLVITADPPPPAGSLIVVNYEEDPL